MTCTCRILTAPSPGAVAIIQLTGDVRSVLADLTGKAPVEVGHVAVRRLGGIDTGLVARLDERIAYVMPHGGRRIVSLLVERLVELGCVVQEAATDPRDAYPEAQDAFEALMLGALARAASPMAIDLLTVQPGRWRKWDPSLHPESELADRATRLSRLLTPPIVALVGPPNVGKSTLCNALAGRSASITADRPGTTRDYVGVVIDLGGLVVHWIDTPGIRPAADQIEHDAARLTKMILSRADLIIAADDGQQTPGAGAVPRADIHLRTKCDLPGRTEAAYLSCSARTGEGLAELVAVIRDTLVPPEDRDADAPWLFDERLIAAAQRGA
ncbi:MAG: 50S ribosome-binding GTPase [Phycisphaerales bacterium]|nr:50S ribosome-binding GTPase [Phycisphaerales bacterium]